MEQGFEPFSGSLEEDVGSIGIVMMCKNAFCHALDDFECEARGMVMSACFWRC